MSVSHRHVCQVSMSRHSGWRSVVGHVTRIATASPTGTGNSVVTLSEQRRELVTGGSFDLTTIVPIGHPRRIGLFAKLDLPKYMRE